MIMEHKTTISSQLFDRAKKTIPGGVNSPVRAFKTRSEERRVGKECRL